MHDVKETLFITPESEGQPRYQSGCVYLYIRPLKVRNFNAAIKGSFI